MADNNTNSLRQAKNIIHIEGILSEKNLEVKEDIKHGEGKDDAITGTLSIEVAPNSVHTVSVFAFKTKKDGTENSVFKGLLTVKNEYKAIADEGVGRENADKVRVNRGQLGLNEYVGTDGAVRSFPQVSTNFVNRVTEGDKVPYKPTATFDVEGYITATKRETKDGEETGRLLVSIAVPQYGGRIAPLSFVVEKGADEFEDGFPKGTSAEFSGNLVNFREKVERVEEGGFGQPRTVVSYNTKRDAVITWASEPYEDDDKKYYSPEIIKAALVEHENYVEGLKNREHSNSSSAKTSGGFSAEPETSDDSDDLPF